MSSLIIGLTGGIGSGKTAASDYFSSMGVSVIDADIIAREVVEPGQPAWQAIKERYGNESVLEDGTLNRPWLRQKVFSNTDERTWLESQTHPRIRSSMIQQLSEAVSPYSILVSPLLFESKQDELVEKTLVIDVSEELQIERSCARDQNDREQIERIIAAQMSRSERIERADFIADNSKTPDDLYRQLNLLHNEFIQLSRQIDIHP